MMRYLRILAAVACLALTATCGRAAPAVQFQDKPATAKIPVPAAVTKSNVILLQLREVIIPASAQGAWHVFCEFPEADSRTSVDHPSFCGSVSVLAYGAGSVRQPANFTLQLPPPVAASVRRLKELRLTFVPVSNAPISIGSIALE
jgi:hypothetical protein